ERRSAHAEPPTRSLRGRELFGGVLHEVLAQAPSRSSLNVVGHLLLLPRRSSAERLQLGGSLIGGLDLFVQFSDLGRRLIDHRDLFVGEVALLGLRQLRNLQSLSGGILALLKQ